jgi:hypothetical protein
VDAATNVRRVTIAVETGTARMRHTTKTPTPKRIPKANLPRLAYLATSRHAQTMTRALVIRARKVGTAHGAVAGGAAGAAVARAIARP